MTTSTTRFARIAVGVVAGAVLLAGCSGGSDSSTAASATADGGTAAENEAFNNADVTFVQAMIPHHRGALAMAQLADGRAEDSSVIELAGRIEAAQQPEIETMTGWLEEWGEPLPDESDTGMGGMDHGSDDGGMDMGGMSGEDMTMLESASGAEFDRMFLELMIRHHRGAVDMAQTEIDAGSYPDAVALAEDIVESQTAEIEEMQTLLSELGS